jgi:ABC-2 type transport system ATP-binding protein
MEPVIDLRDVVVVLGRFPALAGATLQVQRGEIVLLQGPNGAGKTTILRLCAGLVPMARGAGRVLGADLARERRSVRSRVGLLGHSNGLYEDLSGEENVRFWARTVGATDDEIASALRRLGPGGDLGATKVARLSAGQRRRVALAALVARRPELWLLDEPHAGLDAEGRDLIDQTLRAAADAGATVLVASHEVDRAAAVARRAVRVEGGRVVDALPDPAPPAPVAVGAPAGVAPC